MVRPAPKGDGFAISFMLILEIQATLNFFGKKDTQFGDFFHDMVLHLRLGQVAADDADDATRFVRYVDRVGQKAVKKVKFTVNGNPLDEYDSEVHNMHQKFNIGINYSDKDLV